MRCLSFFRKSCFEDLRIKWIGRLVESGRLIFRFPASGAKALLQSCILKNEVCFIEVKPNMGSERPILQVLESYIGTRSSDLTHL